MLNLTHVKHLKEKTYQLKNILHEFEDLKNKYVQEKEANEKETQERDSEIRSLKDYCKELREKIVSYDMRVKDYSSETYNQDYHHNELVIRRALKLKNLKKNYKK